MTAPRADLSQGHTGSPLGRRRESPHRGHLGQLVGVEGLAVLVVGAALVVRNWLGLGEETGPDILVQAVPAMAVAAVVAVVAWIGWAARCRRLRRRDVATALLLIVVSLLGFLALYVVYGWDQG